MAVRKTDLLDRLEEAQALCQTGRTELLAGCPMITLFTIIEQVEERMAVLRELTVKHSKEVAAHVPNVAGVRLNGKPDRRFKAAKRV